MRCAACVEPLLLTACTPAPTAVESTSQEMKLAATPIKVTASIQEMMEAFVDPHADGVWDSVGTTISAKGMVNHQPHSDAEWKQVRLHAVALIEATNLLAMDGRRLVPEGGKIADEGEQGVLTTTAGEELLKTDHATFVAFAHALHDVSEEMLKAIDAKNPETMMTVGERIDEVCEACHTKFWYPNQAVYNITTSQSSAR
jgi:hypothetical protein